MAFERFSSDAARVIVLAQDEARMLRHDHIGVGHILLGLLGPGTATDPRRRSTACRALTSLGVTLERARAQVRSQLGEGDASRAGHIPFSPSAKAVLERAFVEAADREDEWIAPEHLLLASIHDEGDFSAGVLRGLGVDVDQVRQAVLEAIAERDARAGIAPPVILLRPMRDDEWDVWHAWAMNEYAGDLLRNGSMTPEEALVQATEEVDRFLPERLATPGHHLLIAEDAGDGRRVGYLWFGPRTRNPDPDVAWLYDIFVEESERGRGIAKAMLELFEVEARASGCRRVELNVFGDNATAKHLYGAMGYVEMARQMGKDIDS